MLNCHQATQLASQRLDEPLPPGRRLALTLHLVMCVYCRRFARQIGRLRLLAGNLPAVATDRLSPEARDRIRKALAKRR